MIFSQFIDSNQISFLSKETQEWVYDAIQSTGCAISATQSAEIKDLFKEDKLTMATLRKVLNPVKIEKRKVVFNSKKLDGYFTPDMTNDDIEELILKLLDEWKEKGGAS